jgi:hypothetical protein
VPKEYELDERASEARTILNSPLYKEVMEKMERDFTDRMRNAPIGSPESQAAHAMLKVLAEFQLDFVSIINDQKMAQRKVRYGG